jgi:hypothetical protein
MGKKFSELLEEHTSLVKEKEDYELGLKAMRGPNFEHGIEKDERKSVKILYEGLMTARGQLSLFDEKLYIEEVPADPTPVDDGSTI